MLHSNCFVSPHVFFLKKKRFLIDTTPSLDFWSSFWFQSQIGLPCAQFGKGVCNVRSLGFTSGSYISYPLSNRITKQTAELDGSINYSVVKPLELVEGKSAVALIHHYFSNVRFLSQAKNCRLQVFKFRWRHCYFSRNFQPLKKKKQ